MCRRNYPTDVCNRGTAGNLEIRSLIADCVWRTWRHILFLLLTHPNSDQTRITAQYILYIIFFPFRLYLNLNCFLLSSPPLFTLTLFCTPYTLPNMCMKKFNMNTLILRLHSVLVSLSLSISLGGHSARSIDLDLTTQAHASPISHCKQIIPILSTRKPPIPATLSEKPFSHFSHLRKAQHSLLTCPVKWCSRFSFALFLHFFHNYELNQHVAKYASHSLQALFCSF